MTSSHGFARSRVFEPGASPRVILVLGALHCCAVTAVWMSPWHWTVELGLSILLIAACLDAIRVHGLRRGGRAWRRVEYLGDGRWRLTRRDGRVVSGRLHADSFVHPWLVVIGIHRHSLRQHFVPVPGDALHAPEHRRLRVWLRWAN